MTWKTTIAWVYLLFFYPIFSVIPYVLDYAKVWHGTLSIEQIIIVNCIYAASLVIATYNEKEAKP